MFSEEVMKAWDIARCAGKDISNLQYRGGIFSLNETRRSGGRPSNPQPVVLYQQFADERSLLEFLYNR